MNKNSLYFIKKGKKLNKTYIKYVGFKNFNSKKIDQKKTISHEFSKNGHLWHNF